MEARKRLLRKGRGMPSIFSSPDIPKPQPPIIPKVEDMATDNAARTEKARRMRSLGKQQSIFAGNVTSSPTLLTTKLGGGG